MDRTQVVVVAALQHDLVANPHERATVAARASKRQTANDLVPVRCVGVLPVTTGGNSGSDQRPLS